MVSGYMRLINLTWISVSCQFPLSLRDPGIRDEPVAHGVLTLKDSLAAILGRARHVPLATAAKGSTSNSEKTAFCPIRREFSSTLPKQQMREMEQGKVEEGIIPQLAAVLNGRRTICRLGNVNPLHNAELRGWP